MKFDVLIPFRVNRTAAEAIKKQAAAEYTTQQQIVRKSVYMYLKALGINIAADEEKKQKKKSA
jgi:hypothetical protein